jgi:glycerol-3-phosphate acyltransferase PlsY
MTTVLIIALASFILGYLFGSFPTGFFVGKLWNVDVRKHGSGRTGGTNVLRTVGWRAFTLTVIGDILKGVVPVLLARYFFPEYHSAHAATVLGVLLGHNWSIWIALLAKPDPNLKFAPPPLGWLQRIAQQGRGGAGVATTAGAVLAMFPPVPLLIAPIGIAALLITRYASVGSLTAAILFPIVMLFFVLRGDVGWSYEILAIIVSIIVIVVHRPNIERLRAGNERRFGARLGQRQTKS